jgi:hypothetical protein
MRLMGSPSARLTIEFEPLTLIAPLRRKSFYYGESMLKGGLSSVSKHSGAALAASLLLSINRRKKDGMVHK